MARLFDHANTEYLSVAKLPVSSTPFTVSLWFNTPEDVSSYVAFAIADAASNNYWAIFLSSGGATNDVRANAWDTVTNANANSTTFFLLNKWHHVTAFYISDISRAVLLDGGGKGTNAADISPAGVDTTYIGARRGDFTVDGMLAEVAVWDTTLTDREGMVLASGVPPLFVRPQNRVAYWPLVSAEDFDWDRRFDMTAVNSPGIAPHPPKVLEFWRRYRMRAVTTQGISRLVSWGVPNEWNLRTRLLVRIPRYGFTNFQIPGIV